MSLRELTDVLTALLFYDILLSFMLTGSMAVLKAIVSLYRAGEKMPIERYTDQGYLKSRKRITYFRRSIK